MAAWLPLRDAGAVVSHESALELHGLSDVTPNAIGFRSDDALEAEALRTDDFLGFAEIEPVEVQGVPLELQVAEKLHAYTRVYEGGRTSSRTKDLIDLALIAELSQLDAAGLRREIDTIFELRGTHAAPDSLPPPPAEWAVPFRRLAEEVGVPAELAAGHRDAAALVDPILSGKVPSGTWDSTRRRWAAEKSSEGRRPDAQGGLRPVSGKPLYPRASFVHPGGQQRVDDAHPAYGGRILGDLAAIDERLGRTHRRPTPRATVAASSGIDSLATSATAARTRR